MNFLKKIKIKSFNERSHDEPDAHWFCEENITVLEAHVPNSMYFVCKSKAFVVLKKKQKQLKKLFDLWHEIGHHLLHSVNEYETHSFGLVHSKNETEANAFATVAIVPSPMIDGHEFVELHPRSPFARKLHKDSQKLAFLYSIK
jgi:Zn-dependent peptidase ImmA (M78 family)